MRWAVRRGGADYSEIRNTSQKPARRIRFARVRFPDQVFGQSALRVPDPIRTNRETRYGIFMVFGPVDFVIGSGADTMETPTNRRQASSFVTRPIEPEGSTTPASTHTPENAVRPPKRPSHVEESQAIRHYKAVQTSPETEETRAGPATVSACAATSRDAAQPPDRIPQRPGGPGQPIDQSPGSVTTRAIRS
jgi:hypothetical protein